MSQSAINASFGGFVNQQKDKQQAPVKVYTVSSSAATVTANEGILSATLTTAAVTAETWTITCPYVSKQSRVYLTLQDYPGTIVTNGIPLLVGAIDVDNGTFKVVLFNSHASNAFTNSAPFLVAFKVEN